MCFQQENYTRAMYDVAIHYHLQRFIKRYRHGGSVRYFPGLPVQSAGFGKDT